jgi:capsular polysaccharide transport system permease protein
MNIHLPQELLDEVAATHRRQTPWQALQASFGNGRGFLFVVVIPTLVAALYFGLIASDQYVSEAHFVVRVAGNNQASSSGLGQLLGLGQSLSPSQTESQALGDYLTSDDAVDVLQRRLGLTAMFQRNGIDLFSRLRHDPAPETVLKYYRRQVSLHYSGETGITSMEVRAFRPDDAYRIASTLLEIGEQRVNKLNQRAYDDAVRVSRGQLADAEAELSAVQLGLTRFRQKRQDIDPVRSSTAQIELVSKLRTDLATARAELAAARSATGTASLPYHAARQRVAALAAQVASEHGRIVGGSHAMAAGLSDYEDLQMHQDFASKRYSAAAAALESAREQAVRQQLFVVRVDEPNHPVKSLYPRRLWTIFGIIVGALLVYGIGWLIVAGVREHAA